MSATFERIGQTPRLYGAPVPPDDPLVRAWLRKLHEQNPHFSHGADTQPGFWYGLYVLGTLRSVIGFTYCPGNVVMVEYVMCEPSKAGYATMRILLAGMREQWKSMTIRCYCESVNMRIRRIIEGLGARPVALMYEVEAQ